MKFPHGTILLLGLVTIAAYGAWFYAFGVLFDPILDDTGWPESALAATFSMAAALGAISAVPAGRLTDRFGARVAFLLAAVLSTTGLWVATAADHFVVFAVGAIVGGGSLQGLAFYHVTQAAAVRAAPDEANRAIALLTIYGAFSSAIFLPLAARLVSTEGWRSTLRILVSCTAAVLVTAAILIREPTGDDDQRVGARVAPDFRLAFRQLAARRFVVGSGLAGFGIGAMLVYQVPLMTGAGLPIGVAAWMAGARGAAQITGRIPLAFIVNRIGARASVQLAFGFVASSVILLAFAGNVMIALLWVAAAGFGIGATSPLQGIYANELFDRAHLGASMGVITMVFGLSSAAGPTVVGLIADLTGTRWLGVALTVVAGVGAVVAVGDPQPKAAASRWPASLSIASFLAKQKRTRRSPSRRS
ncbi:MAG: MFS transporter [Acidimicrobiia bacterium]|nr:MFS transporter [Acidimicrobiia bacterium]